MGESVNHSQTKRRTFLKQASVLAGSSGVLAGCIGGGNGDGKSSLPEKITIGHPSPARPIYNVPIYSVFKDRMKERGVTIEQKTFKGYTPLIAGMTKNEVDIAETSLPSLIKSRNQNFPIVAFTGWTQQYVRGLLVKKDITSWSDLRGKTLVGHSPSSLTNLVLREMVRQELGENANVEYSNIIGTPNRIAALKSNEITATGVFESGARQAERDGVGHILAHAWDYFDNQSIAVWGTLQKNIDQNENLYQVISDELVNSYKEMYSKKSKTIIDSLDMSVGFPSYDSDIYVETLKSSTKNQVWPTDPSNMLTTEKMSRSRDIMKRVGIIDESADLESAVDRRFLQK